MGIRIKTNVESLIAQRRLSDSKADLGQSLERLSSGQRINKSADDAAGLAVSERIRTKIRSLNVAKRNASDGISYIQVAEGGLNEVTNIVVRMRELGAQAASDTIGNRERGYLDKEFQQMKLEVDRILATTEFNGSKVLRPDNLKPISIFVGASNRASDASGNPPEVDPDNNPDVVQINFADVEKLSADFAPLFEDSVKVTPDDIETGGAGELGDGDTNMLFNKLDTALNSIAEYRATLGSVQSRLNSTVTNIDVTNENLAAAQSRIRDVDYAAETAKYAQARILTQAGSFVLTQANSTPEIVLNLLRA